MCPFFFFCSLHFILYQMKHFATAFFICLVFITLTQARPIDGVTTNEVSGKGHSQNFKHTKTTVYTVGSDDGTTMEVI